MRVRAPLAPTSPDQITKLKTFAPRPGRASTCGEVAPSGVGRYIQESKSNSLNQRPSVTEAVHRLRSALADRYRIEQEIGQGGMATVYLAHDLRHERRWVDSRFRQLVERIGLRSG